VKILDFLKGGTMKIQFNEAQLSRPQRESLIKVLDVLQVKNENELVVMPVEFPNKLLVMLDDNIGMLLGWDVDKQSYAGLTVPESPNKPKAGTIKPFELPEPESLTETKLEPELDLSPVFERAEALARVLINLSKPLNTEQRIEVWVKFCLVLSKEFME